MKAKWCFIFFVLLVLGFGLFLAGCASAPRIEIAADSTPTNIEGTWKGHHPNAQNATFKFTGNQFVYTRTGINNSGFIVLTDTDLQLVVDGKIVRNYPYEVDANYLYLSQGCGQGQIYYYGEFQKE